MNKNNGFTLMEVLIAAALLGLVVVTAVAIHLAANTFFQSSTSQTKSQDEAAITMEHIMRNIKRGFNANITSANQRITIYVQEPNLANPSNPFQNRTKVRYWHTGNNLRYYPESISNSWGTGYTTISTKITDLNFLEVHEFTQPPPPPMVANRINIQVQLTAEDQGESTSLDSTSTCFYRPVQYPWE